MSIVSKVYRGMARYVKGHNNKKSELLEKHEDRNLYRTYFGDKFYLNPSNYLDNEIINSGVWEPQSTAVVKKIIKQGDIVLDVGANIGYYTVIMSRLVGKKGKIISFEPTEWFGKVLRKNIIVNGICNCEIKDYGLSDHNLTSSICIGTDTATMHWVDDGHLIPSKENIVLNRLDDIVDSLDIPRIDFIKIDVDGHEPAFLKGAINTIKRFKPIILLEVAHLNYLDAGVTVWDFYEYLKANGFHIYYEDNLEECRSKRDFLVKCGNFAYSANIVISESSLIDKLK